jgi:Ser/Thr protein kinase RdoA (MazF antagonist)
MTEKFPAINSTLSPDGLGQLIKRKYGLSDKTECRIFRLAMNHLYIVHYGENKYVFRVYTHNWRTKLEIAEEVRLLTLLKEAGRPVAFPIADHSNQFVQEIEAPEGM